MPLIDPDQLLMPYVARISPDVERSRTHHYAWIEKHGLCPDRKTNTLYRQADFPLFMGYVWPWATGDDLDLVNDYIGWTWVLDDAVDQPGPRQADVRMIEQIGEDVCDAVYGRLMRRPVTPLLAAWREILERMADRTSETWQRRHASLWEDVCRANVQEARNNAAGRIPTLAEYLPMRRDGCGVNICFILTEAAGRYELPAHLHESNELRMLVQHGSDVVSMTNDIYSVHNEWSGGNTDNIVPVLAQQENCSWAEAAELAVPIINTTVVDFQEAEERLLRSGLYLDLDPQDQTNLLHYIDGMKLWMSGSLAWHRVTVRYRQTMAVKTDIPGKIT